MTTTNRPKAHHQRGFSLVEVLVAVFILAIGVLGAAALQMNALKFNQTASVRSQATFLAYEIVDRMRANREAALAGNYDLALTAGNPNCANPGSGASPACDLLSWRQALANRLPQGGGAVARNGTVFTITVQWDESRLGLADDPNTQLDERFGQFVFETAL